MPLNSPENTPNPPPLPRVALDYGQKPSPGRARSGTSLPSARVAPIADFSSIQEAPLLGVPRRKTTPSSRPGHNLPFDPLEAIRTRPLEADNSPPRRPVVAFRNPRTIFPSPVVHQSRVGLRDPIPFVSSHEVLQKLELEYSPQTCFPYARHMVPQDRHTTPDPRKLVLPAIGFGDNDALTYWHMERQNTTEQFIKREQRMRREELKRRSIPAFNALGNGATVEQVVSQQPLPQFSAQPPTAKSSMDVEDGI